MGNYYFLPCVNNIRDQYQNLDSRNCNSCFRQIEELRFQLKQAQQCIKNQNKKIDEQTITINKLKNEIECNEQNADYYKQEIIRLNSKLSSPTHYYSQKFEELEDQELEDELQENILSSLIDETKENINISNEFFDSFQNGETTSFRQFENY